MARKNQAGCPVVDLQAYKVSPVQGGGEMIDRHLRWCKARNLRPSTMAQRRRALVRFSRTAGVELLDCGRDVLDEWYDDLVDRLTPEGRATELAHVRGFYRWALFEGLVPEDPTARLVRPRIPRKLPNPMPQDHLEHALGHAPARIRPWLYLAAYAGLRCAEIAPLRAEHLRFTGPVRVILIMEQKGGDMGVVTAPPALVDALEHLPRKGWLFPLLDGRPGPVGAHLVSQVGNRWLHSQGIAHTMHSLRHWFGTELYRASGRDLLQTQRGMRHRSVVSTQGYTWVDPGELVDITARLPGASGRHADVVAIHGRRASDQKATG